MAAKEPNSYDEIPYDSLPDPYCNPALLSTIGRLFGHAAPDVTTARVLELGCANGGNLLPLAMAYPQATFKGIDLSPAQVGDAKVSIQEAGLKNVEVLSLNIMQVDQDFGEFDYILTHGVFSWVPHETQQKILQICQENLSPDGIAYLSYNTYPGWHFRGMVREMMLYHTNQFADATTRVQQARALLNLLIESTEVDETSTYGGAYGRLLSDEAEILHGSSDSYLFHEHLEDHNEPLYFHHFIERAEEKGLRFLGEAIFGEMVPKNFSDEIGITLANISQGIIQMEQYMDFIKNRMFRRTLLVHNEVELNRELSPSKLAGLYASTALKPVESDADPLKTFEMSFEHPGGTTVEISKPMQKLGLCHLANIWPRSSSVEELAKHCRTQLGDEHPPTTETDADAIGDLLIECYTSGLVDLSTTASCFTTNISERPIANSLARYQASLDRNVTSLAHRAFRMAEIDRQVLILCDGTRDTAQMVVELEKLAKEGKIDVEHNDQPVTDPAKVKEVLTEAVQLSFKKLARNAILMIEA